VLILLFINFIELIVCFAVAYLASAHLLRMNDLQGPSIGNGLYFSVITQTTIGYGDLQPVSFGKVLAVGQALVGSLFALIILARFVRWLPTMSATGQQPRDR
jgi:hypothetical protein